jgi:hypothetical protein
MLFNPSPTELTTAATDAAMGVLSLVLLRRLASVPTPLAWTRAVWAWVFRLFATASLLGAVVHGLALAEAIRSLLWLPLYLALGLVIALFVVGAVSAWRGERSARMLAPWAIACGTAFFAASQLLGGAFVIFLAYEAVGMLIALGIYGVLAVRGAAGARAAAAGIALTMVAAGVQASSLQVRLVVPFDHNGLFHIVQMAAVVVVARGVKVGLIRPFATAPR